MKEVRKSSCKMCHGGCGVLVHLEDGEVVKVEGDRESPLNRGRIVRQGAGQPGASQPPRPFEVPDEAGRGAGWGKVGTHLLGRCPGYHRLQARSHPRGIRTGVHRPGAGDRPAPLQLRDQAGQRPGHPQLVRARLRPVLHPPLEHLRHHLRRVLRLRLLRGGQPRVHPGLGAQPPGQRARR